LNDARVWPGRRHEGGYARPWPAKTGVTALEAGYGRA
jgi:hypothetical protein